MDDHFYNLQTFLTFSYHDNSVDTYSGHRSESSGTVSFTASGGDDHRRGPRTLVGADEGGVRDVHRGRRWPHRVGAAGVSEHHADIQDAFGMPTAQRDDRRDCDLRFTLTRALTAGEQVTFDWTAAVQPWPDGVTVPAYAE